MNDIHLFNLDNSPKYNLRPVIADTPQPIIWPFLVSQFNFPNFYVKPINLYGIDPISLFTGKYANDASKIFPSNKKEIFKQILEPINYYWFSYIMALRNGKT